MDNITHVFDAPVLNGHAFGELESLIDKVRNRILLLRKVDLDIIRFLAVNGPNPCYSMYEGPIMPRKRGRPPIRKIHRIPKRAKSEVLPYDF